MSIGKNGEVYYDYEQNRLLKKYKVRGFFFKHFRMFKKRFKTERDIKVRFDYYGVLKKHEILYSSPNYSIEKLYRTKFFIKRKIEETTIELTSYNDLTSIQIGIIGAIFAFLSIVCNLMWGYFQSSGFNLWMSLQIVLFYIFIMTILLRFHTTKQDEKMIDKRKSLSNLLKLYNLKYECIKREIAAREQNQY